MATLGVTVPTMLDVAKRTDPDGKIARIVELLNQTNEILDDMSWKEGNLQTGERTTVRTGLPAVGFRRLNEGIPISKSTTAQVDEGAAMLEGFSQVDRELAVLSGDPAAYRLSESAGFMEAMNERMALTLFYGNARYSNREFTGLAPRYNSLSGITAPNILDAGGSGTHLRSVWLVGWAPDRITGIYPKGSKGGLSHQDMTSNKEGGTDGYAVGDILYDASGNPYIGYRDHYLWRCGLSVKDWRYAVRIANVDIATLTKDYATGADLVDLMIQAEEHMFSMSGVRPVFYAPRVVSTALRRQITNHKNVLISVDEVAGKKVTSFDGIPVRRVDQLNVDEARVV